MTLKKLLKIYRALNSGGNIERQVKDEIVIRIHKRMGERKDKK